MNRDEFKEYLAGQAELFDKKLDKRFAEQEARFEKKLVDALERNSAILFGQLTKYFDKRLDARLEPLEAKFEHM